jgi:hypothetical protein
LNAIPTSSQIDENEGLLMSNTGTNTTAANGGIQVHGCAFTPTFVIVVSQNSTEQIICGVTSITATGFTYQLHDDTGATVTGQTVMWMASAKPAE